MIYNDIEVFFGLNEAREPILSAYELHSSDESSDSSRQLVTYRELQTVCKVVDADEALTTDTELMGLIKFHKNK